jgi:hypothetical protein
MGLRSVGKLEAADASDGHRKTLAEATGSLIRGQMRMGGRRPLAMTTNGRWFDWHSEGANV